MQLPQIPPPSLSQDSLGQSVDSEQGHCDDPLLEHGFTASEDSNNTHSPCNCGTANPKQTFQVQGKGNAVTFNTTKPVKNEEEPSANNTQTGDSGSKIESLLRAIGLKVVSSVVRKLRPPLVSEEPKKCVSSKNTWLTLTQASVHLLPTIASLTLIWYNTKEQLLGEYFNGWTQFGLQIGAKSHVSCSLPSEYYSMTYRLNMAKLTFGSRN